MLEGPHKNYVVGGTSPFHRHLLGPMSQKDVPQSVAKHSDWVLPEPGKVSVSSTKVIEITEMSLEYILLACQRVIRQMNMHWFHIDDFNILCKNDESQMYTSISVSNDEKKFNLEIHLLSDENELFLALISSIENELEHVKEEQKESNM